MLDKKTKPSDLFSDCRVDLTILSLIVTKPMNMNNIALDTNVLIYLFDANSNEKRNKADILLLTQPYIPAQVVSEFLNVSKRLLNLKN